MKVTTACSLAAPLVLGCYSYPSTSDTFRDQIVVTRYDTTADFGGYTTFTVSPQVLFVDTAEAEPVATEVSDAVASLLVEEVVTQLSNRGYQQVDPEDEPELGAKITVVKGTVEGVDYYTYWGGYGYYSPYYWGYYYPYTVPVYYDYNTTLAKVDLVDVRTALPAELAAAADANDDDADPVAPPEDLRALWTTAIYGVLEGTTEQEARQAADAIDQAFEQSPYLRAQ